MYTLHIYSDLLLSIIKQYSHYKSQRNQSLIQWSHIEMENMSYMSTSFQTNESSAPVYDDLATDHDNQLKPSQGPHNGPKGSMYSELGEYARLSHSGPSTEKILRPHYHSSVESDQHSPYESSQLYDTADVSFNQPTDNNGRGQDTYTVKSQQSVQYTAGKGLLAAIIILQALILMLLVCVLVVLLLKDSCTSDTSSNSTGLTNSGNTAINSNLSLIQKNVEHIKEHCATKNSSFSSKVIWNISWNRLMIMVVTVTCH